MTCLTVLFSPVNELSSPHIRQHFLQCYIFFCPCFISGLVLVLPVTGSGRFTHYDTVSDLYFIGGYWIVLTFFSIIFIQSALVLQALFKHWEFTPISIPTCIHSAIFAMDYQILQKMVQRSGTTIKHGEYYRKKYRDQQADWLST